MEILAYLDPGSGSIILQALLGGVAGFVVAFKMFGARIMSFVKFWEKGKDSADVTASLASVEEATAEPAASLAADK